MVKSEEQYKNLLEQYDKNIRVYQSFVSEIEHQIKNILQVSQINYNAIVSRLKSRESISAKIERKQGKYAQISDITDIAGVRIITYYSEDVDRIAEIIESEFDVDRENSIDKRESLEPDRFGYCSVHYVVKMSPERLVLCEYRAFEGMKCEIQIRSVLQHAWAEIEHDIGYKSEITIPKEMRRSFSRIAGLLEIADKEFNQIRQALTEYKDNAQVQIADDDFLDRELDAVILQVMLKSNAIVQMINQHISNLVREPLDEVESDEVFQATIHRLNWVGIKTVRQLNDALTMHSKLAMKIASEKLKDYSEPGPSSNIHQTIAFFYLCYAMLLANDSSIEEICRYLEENHIGLPGHNYKGAQELFELRKLV